MTSDQFILNEIYQDVECIIWKQIHHFRKRFEHQEATIDNLLSIANETFMDVYTDYDHRRGPFYRRLSFCIWYRFLGEFIQKEARRKKKKKGKCVNLNMNLLQAPTQTFNLFDFLEGLAEDARIVTKLVLDTPNDLNHALRMDSSNPNGYTIRSGLRQYLLGLGWTAYRIDNSFSEIAAALRS